MMNEEQLRAAAGDYVAGDLEAEERLAFEKLLEQDEALADDCAFWRRMQVEMPKAGRSGGSRSPGPDFAAVVRRRAERELRPRLSISGVVGWCAAAAAGIALLIVLQHESAAPSHGGERLVAYGEDGSALYVPAVNASHADLYPEDPPVPASSIDVGTTERPWLGVWIRPVRIGGLGERERGLQVQRVAVDSPAAQAGVRPGDVLLNLAGCPMLTRFCIRNAMREEELQPGDRVPMSFWRPSEDRIYEVETVLGCCLE